MILFREHGWIELFSMPNLITWAVTFQMESLTHRRVDNRASIRAVPCAEVQSWCSLYVCTKKPWTVESNKTGQTAVPCAHIHFITRTEQFGRAKANTRLNNNATLLLRPGKANNKLRIHAQKNKAYMPASIIEAIDQRDFFSVIAALAASSLNIFKITKDYFFVKNTNVIILYSSFLL